MFEKYLNKFSRLMGQIRHLTSRFDLLSMAFLVVSRSNTLHTNTCPYRTGPDKIYEIQASHQM